MKKRTESSWQKEVRENLENRDMTITQLGKEINCERTQLSKVINEYKLDRDVAKAINTYLGIQVPYPYGIPD